MKPNSSIIINPLKNKQIYNFLKGKYGCVYEQLKNIYLDGWYFASKYKSVGANHGF